jgi:hypothetical protein
MDAHGKPETGTAHSARGDARILEFRRRLPLQQRGCEKPIADPLRHFEDQEDRRRMQQNLAALAVVLLIIVSGFWLIDHLRTSARIAACVEAGHRNCVPLDLDWKPDR